MNTSFPMLKAMLTASLILVAASTVQAAANNPNTDWFGKARYGVFVHFLAKVRNDPKTIQSLGRQTSWDECVNGFDAERFARSMKEAGAGYVIFTMNQQTRFLVAPNAAFDRISGYHRDLSSAQEFRGRYT